MSSKNKTAEEFLQKRQILLYSELESYPSGLPFNIVDLLNEFAAEKDSIIAQKDKEVENLKSTVNKMIKLKTKSFEIIQKLEEKVNNSLIGAAQSTQDFENYPDLRDSILHAANNWKTDSSWSNHLEQINILCKSSAEKDYDIEELKAKSEKMQKALEAVVKYQVSDMSARELLKLAVEALSHKAEGGGSNE